MIRDTELIKNIKTKNITWDEFLKYENCPVQRNHIKRAEDKKTRIKLGKLQSQHLCIATAELIKESYKGTLIYDFYHHDISDGPLKTHDMGEY